MKPASAASTASPVGRRSRRRRQLALEVVGRRRRPEADRRAVAPCGRARWYSTTRVPWPRKTGSTPEANGSSVPPCPTRFVAARRRTRATTSCEVGPAGLATTRMPSSPGPSDARAIVSDGRSATSRPASARTGGRRVRDGQRRSSPRPPGHARRRRTRRSGPSRRRRPARVRTLSRVAARVLLEQDGHLGVLGLGEQVDDPLRVRRLACRSRRGRRRSASTRRCGRRPRVSSRSRTRPNRRSWASGLDPVEPARDVRERGAGLDERGRDGERPRRRVRMGEGRRVHDDAGHQRGGQRAAVEVERDAEAERRAARPSRRSRRRPGRSSRPRRRRRSRRGGR